MSRASIVLAAFLAAAIIAPAATAEPLGRLFTTPEERAMLERLRHAPPPVEKPVVQQVEVPPAPPVQPPTPPPPVPSIKVKGAVARSGGEGTAWVIVNGVSTLKTLNDDLSSQYISVDTRRMRNGEVPIELPDATVIRLKPGQTYAPAPAAVDADFGPDPSR